MLGEHTGKQVFFSLKSVLLLVFLLSSQHLMADPQPLISVGLALGFDSNPAQLNEASELAFAHYSVDGSQQAELNDMHIDLLLNAWYRDYEGSNDNYRLSAQGRWLRDTQQGRGLISFSLDGVLYRDQLVPADERNEAAARLGYDYLLSARNELSLSLELRALVYRNASLPWAGRPGGGAKDLSNGNEIGPAAQKHRSVRRDDGLATLLLEATQHWTPALSNRLSLRFARLDSPVPVEAYQHYGALLSTAFGLTPDWLLELGLGWYHTGYDRAPRQLERDDERFSAVAALRRNIGAGELFCEVSYLDNRSSIKVKSFRQTVSECGLAWTF